MTWNRIVDLSVIFGSISRFSFVVIPGNYLSSLIPNPNYKLSILGLRASLPVEFEDRSFRVHFDLLTVGLRFTVISATLVILTNGCLFQIRLDMISLITDSRCSGGRLFNASRSPCELSRKMESGVISISNENFMARY